MGGMNKIAIFKTGRHTATSGDVLDATPEMLAAIAAGYNPTLHESPAVVGHPRHDAPAYGWVRALSFDEPSGVLYADFAQVDPQFADWVAAGRYKKRSASFYTADHPSNPTPGKPYLRHVGFLGAQPPAVKGLADFAGTDEPVYEFADLPDPPQPLPHEETMEKDEELKKKEQELNEREKTLAEKDAELKRKEAELEAEEAAREEAQAADFAESLVKTGQLLPREKAAVVSAILHVGKDATFDFAEGGKVSKCSTAQGLKDVLARLPKTIDFAEHTGDDPNKRALPQASDHVDDDKAAAALDKRIQDFADANGISYAEAAIQIGE